MLNTSLLMYVLAAAPTLSAEAGVRSEILGEPRQFAAVRLIKPFDGVKTQVEVSGDRDAFNGNAKARVRLGVVLDRLQVRFSADRIGMTVEPGAEVRLNVVPRFTVFAEGKAGVDASVLRVGAKYASEKVSCTLEGNSRGDASVVVSLLLI